MAEEGGAKSRIDGKMVLGAAGESREILKAKLRYRWMMSS